MKPLATFWTLAAPVKVATGALEAVGVVEFLEAVGVSEGRALLEGPREAVAEAEAEGAAEAPP